MKKIFKRTLSVFMSVIMLMSVFAFAFTPAMGLDYKDTGLTYDVYDGQVSITGYNGTQESLVIPEKIEGKPVVSFGDYAVFNSSTLKSVTIPKSLTIINSNPFYGCTALENIYVEKGNSNLMSSDGVLYNRDFDLLFAFPAGRAGSFTVPGSVVRICKSAFSGCKKLIGVTLPARLSGINSRAFESCSAITELKIPETVKAIDSAAFFNCSSLKKVNIPSSITKIRSETFSGCISLESITLPAGLTVIGSCAFEHCGNLKKITIPSGISKICGRSFAMCRSLESVTLPDSITEIDWAAFAGCASLKKIDIPKSVNRIDSEVFAGCTSLTSVSIPNSVTEIADGIFLGCSALKSIALPESIEIIGENSFKGSSIRKIVIPDSVNTIKAGAFSGCKALNEITVSADNQSYIISDGVLMSKDKTEIVYALPSVAGKYIIPDTVRAIDDRAFSGCSVLESVIIPETVENIGREAFANCTSLKKAEFAKAFSGTIDSGTFSGCTALEDVILPADMTKIPYSFFMNCSALENVDLPSGITEIGNQAFFGCTKLREINISDKVSVIGSGAFSNCSSLIVNIDEKNEYYVNVDGIVYTKDMTDVIFIPESMSGVWYMPDSVTNISTAIAGFSDVVCSDKNTRYSTVNGFILSKDKTRLLHCPEGKQGVVAVPKCVDYIFDCAFSDCSKITGIDIHSGVKTIGFSAFSGCTSLESIVLPDSVKELLSNAFINCTSLKSVKLSDNLPLIYDYMFKGCTSLESIKIPDSVTRLQMFVFADCPNLKSVEIPSGVTLIDRFAIGFADTSLYLGTKIPGVVIRGENGSVAQAYAKANSIAFFDLNADCAHEKTVTSGALQATCTSQGYSGDVFCTVCGAKIKAGENTPMLAHIFKDGKCTVCSAAEPDFYIVKSCMHKLDTENKRVYIYPESTKAMTIESFTSLFNKSITLADGDLKSVVNGMKFTCGEDEYTVIVLGDINADGKINPSDARMVLRIAARLEKVDEISFIAADINSDGKVTPSEARSVLRFSARLSSSIAG